ncbi:hypothetical protein ASPZODRAFT_122141 [Penicilliopsis zonata CBS 506.65]|uniref:CENP-V/GFA domain-containing protein n=1 Tax=Penicilliopsis zonata CBS 506.65 TaxID=1073090 RepID=A0A1L9SA63_9EURO|nr:hypothetical protein ASPZODRAFT_122141 [Penicilliopsis zonata CBS 506.65]OJJ44007.1 hypothetical protein ASPZODRAFT_122141 [Penicilliopsis zonata CBS 506.65]
MANDTTGAVGPPLPKPAVTNIISEDTGEEESWKHRPPYRIQSLEEFGPVKWKGTCKCGQIAYYLNRDKPLKAKFCHCRGCQVMHGAPFQWAAIFHKADMFFAKGASGLSFYSSAHQTREYETPTKVYCSFCHSPIMDEGRNVCLIFPELIDFGEDKLLHTMKTFYPSCHIFYSERCLEIMDGVEKWSGMDEDSELMDDRGNVKKNS